MKFSNQLVVTFLSENMPLHYKNNFPNQGIAVIFQHTRINEDTNVLNSSSTYKDQICTCLKKYGFDVLTYTNLTLDGIKEVLDDVSKKDHYLNTCLLVIVLSHGLNGKIWAQDKEYSIKTLLKPFSSKNCPSLDNKPKMFLILDCEGEYNQNEINSDKSPDIGSLLENDFLVVHSSFEGETSTLWESYSMKMKRLVWVGLNLRTFEFFNNGSTSVCNANSPHDMFVTSFYDNLISNLDSNEGINFSEMVTNICKCICIDFRYAQIPVFQAVSKLRKSFHLKPLPSLNIVNEF